MFIFDNDRITCQAKTHRTVRFLGACSNSKSWLNSGTRRLRKSLSSNAQTIQKDLRIEKNLKKIGEIPKHDNPAKQLDQDFKAIRPYQYHKTLRYLWWWRGYISGIGACAKRSIIFQNPSRNKTRWKNRKTNDQISFGSRRVSPLQEPAHHPPRHKTRKHLAR